MKTQFRFLIIILAFTSLLSNLTSCKKNDTVDPTTGFSTRIQNIISQQDIDQLRLRGMLINEGSQPPNIEGIYISSPHTLVSPYDGDTYKTGDTFSDLIIRFSNQNSSDLSAQVDIKNGGATGTGVGGFLSGNGNKFTFFAQIDLKSGTATAKQVRIFSGELTSTGIKDFYSTLLITSKNDPNDELIPVGAARIIKDGDGMASKRSSFRMGVENEPTSNLRSESAR